MRTVLSIFLIPLFLMGCSDPAQREEIVTTVKEVRLLVTEETSGNRDTGGDALAGAIIGGVVGHATAGAVIGAASGSGSPTVVSRKVTACRASVEIDGALAVFTVHEFSSWLTDCALLRSGDKIHIIKVTDHGKVQYVSFGRFAETF